MEIQRLKPYTPHHCHLSGVACGGLKPFSVTPSEAKHLGPMSQIFRLLRMTLIVLSNGMREGCHAEHSEASLPSWSARYKRRVTQRMFILEWELLLLDQLHGAPLTV